MGIFFLYTLTFLAEGVLLNDIKIKNPSPLPQGDIFLGNPKNKFPPNPWFQGKYLLESTLSSIIYKVKNIGRKSAKS